MINFLLQIITASMCVATISGNANEDKPKVSILPAEEPVLSEDAVTLRLELTRKRLAELAHNNPRVMKGYDDFSALLSNSFHKEKSMTAKEIEQICAAVEFAADKHRLQTRKNKDKTPYISHPIGVAYLLMQIGENRDTSVIIGALLHDTLEDTQTIYQELEDNFGNVAAGYVKEVTDDRTLSSNARKRMQVVNAAHKSKGAAQIKLADKLYNLRDLLNDTPEEWSQSRIDQYFEWAQSVVDRLPPANDHLQGAVKEMINQYWEKQSDVK